jgi:hypothetical protein
VLLIVATSSPAADLPSRRAVECEPQRPTGAKEWWAYRIIDGRICWYAGRPGKPKTELRWALMSVPGAGERPGGGLKPLEPPVPLLSSDQELADTCCWPALEPTFSERWNDLMIDMAVPFWRWRRPTSKEAPENLR